MNSKIVFKSQLFDVQEEELTRPSGRKVIHHTVLRKPTVTIFPLTENCEIYLASEFREIYNRRVLGGFAGFLKEGETPLEGARRELKEEAGIITGKLTDLGTIRNAASVIKGDSYLYLAQDLTLKKQELEEDEDIKIVKIPLDEAVEKVMKGEISVAASVVGILKIDKMRQKGEI